MCRSSRHLVTFLLMHVLQSFTVLLPGVEKRCLHSSQPDTLVRNNKYGFILYPSERALSMYVGSLS